MRLSALVFHDIKCTGYLPGGAGHSRASKYQIDIETYERIVSETAGTIKYKGVFTDIGAVAPADAENTALFTFDDGLASAYGHAAETLERNGLRGYFFIIGNRIGCDGYLSAGQVKELSERGHVIGNHTFTHPNRMFRLPYQTCLKEWAEGKRALETVLKSEVVTAAIPGGSISDNVIKAAGEAGVRILFTLEPAQEVKTVGATAVIGRFTVFPHMSPSRIIRVVGHDPAELRKTHFYWNIKNYFKYNLSGPYEFTRRILIKP